LEERAFLQSLCKERFQFLEFAIQRKRLDLLCPRKSDDKAQGLLRSWRSN
jgi:hypothetical protein